jgi:hypothetical protein
MTGKGIPSLASAADGDHPTIWLIVIPKVVLLRFSTDNIQKELL